MRDIKNNLIMTLTADFLTNHADAIDSKDIGALSKEFSMDMEEAYRLLFAGCIGLDAYENRMHREIVFNDFPRMIRKIDSSAYEKDEYLMRLSGVSGRTGNVTIESVSIKPFEAFVAGDIREYDDGAVLPQIGWMEKAFSCPAVKEDGRIWMTVMPNEIETIYPVAKKAHGRVLSFGLGLGYFQFHALRNPLVESVTVVEKNERVIDAFQKFLLAHFPKDKKLNILSGDAFQMAPRLYESKKYDFAFSDIWHDAGDGKDMYVKLKQMEKFNKDMEYAYWIEDTLAFYI